MKIQDMINWIEYKSQITYPFDVYLDNEVLPGDQVLKDLPIDTSSLL